jgi:hypothetical protein
MGVEMKNIDCSQCVYGQIGIVLRKTPSLNLTSKEPIKALKVPDLLIFISKSEIKPSFSKGF